jgi:UDP-GlcNAc:undecaprenyl-phosphate/decaprenyl-phosphate GlcNAc-1-phosphate transferase
MLTGLLVLGLYLGFLKVYPEADQVPPGARLLRGTLLYKKQLLQVLLDLQLIPVAFVSAHLLRYEGVLPPAVLRGVLWALPLVLVGKLGGLALCRAYRGVWRSAGPADALAALLGSGLGSLLTGLFLARLVIRRELSPSALVIDWLLFTGLATGVRMGYVLFRELFGRVAPRNAPRVVIVGAGAEALALIQRLRDPTSPGRADLRGIFDDDPGKRQRRLNGVPVLGSVSELPAHMIAHQITCCLLGVSPRSLEGREILAFCHQRGIALCTDIQDLPLALAEDPVHAHAA